MREFASIIASDGFIGCAASCLYFAKVRMNGSISSVGDVGPFETVLTLCSTRNCTVR